MLTSRYVITSMLMYVMIMIWIHDCHKVCAHDRPSPASVIRIFIGGFSLNHSWKRPQLKVATELLVSDQPTHVPSLDPIRTGSIYLNGKNYTCTYVQVISVAHLSHLRVTPY